MTCVHTAILCSNLMEFSNGETIHFEAVRLDSVKPSLTK